MIGNRLMKGFAQWMSRALLGPVQVHGGALDGGDSDVDVILVPHRLSPLDCWLFWSRLARPPVFYQDGRFSRCLGYRWLAWRGATDPVDAETAQRAMLACIRVGKCLVLAIETRSPSAVERLERQLKALQRGNRALRLQLLTFNYDYRHLLGSPVHWIWRPHTLDAAKTDLDLNFELRALQKRAWSVLGYQTLPQRPLSDLTGRIPSSLVLSWHEVRSGRRLARPSGGTWPWLPVAVLCACVNLLPLAVTYWWSHRPGPWRIDRLAVWLGPMYLANHLVIGALALVGWGAWGWLYLPCLIVGVHPLGHLTRRLVRVEDSSEARAVRERILNYFD